jgi:hypothetical protein
VQVVEVHQPATILAYSPPSRPRTHLPNGPSAARKDASGVTEENNPSLTLPVAEVVDRLLETLQYSDKEELLVHLRALSMNPPLSSSSSYSESGAYSAAAALQSGGVDEFPLWNVGINGTNEFVHVTDTGADDASCFLRDFGPNTSLAGPFSPSMQVNRSVWNSTITDFKFRKVVQYVGHEKGHPLDFFQDYKGGHGSHVAATVAGSKSDPDEPITFGADATNCTLVNK